MKVAVGLSGGVDSAVSAHLLVEAGHEVTGVFLECWRAPGCRAEEDRRDALRVALDLGIPFRVLDFREVYRKKVVDRFFSEYAAGRTPNPDIWCNTEVKFGLFYDWALSQGFDAVATGHYAQMGEQGSEKFSQGAQPQGEVFQKSSRKFLPEVESREKSSPSLLRSADEKKDQTYFLYRIRPDQVDHILFPIGHLTKEQVRTEAEKRQIIVSKKPDSQGICFIGEIDVRGFLREHLGEKPGNVLDVDGNIVGSHNGHWFFTIGQRHGFTLFPEVYTKNAEWKHVLPPLYVISKNADTNSIVVGYGHETVVETARVTDVFFREPALLAAPIVVRLRHGGQLVPVAILSRKDASGAQTQLSVETINADIELQFAEAQRGVAPGQAIVFYGGTDFSVCMGGGVVA